jgi:20S proteasome alpha/beta subunit
MKISNKIAKKSEKNQDCDQYCWVVISGSKGDIQKWKFGCF